MSERSTQSSEATESVPEVPGKGALAPWGEEEGRAIVRMPEETERALRGMGPEE
ncbi:MAG TPA: hypothetical protein VM582_00485 [Candidatus Thermoplasmatota archaeon]|nr:hypothetical protein [Candidatus Thermoplasmatota archaeon]